jgi:glutathione S-transferase
MPLNINTTLYYSPGSCSLASHIILEEAGKPFESVRVLTSAGEHKTAQYLAINPKGRVPALSDGGWILTETPAILKYICDQNADAKLWPTDIRHSARCSEWLSWIQTNLDVAVSQVSRTERYVEHSDGADVIASGKRKIKEIALEVDRKLEGRSWALGDAFSPVDAYLLVYWLASFRPLVNLNLKAACPAWAAHAERVWARPAVQRVTAREGLQLP